MADDAKRPRLDIEAKDYGFLADEKVARVLSKYPSTVFACDTSADTRYIKCDFPKCAEHPRTSDAKPPWILNTLKNVKTLEKHVGKQIAMFTRENLPGSDSHFANSDDIIKSQTLLSGTMKVLAVFNLEDPQSQLGEWISLFLKAAELKLDADTHGVEVITQSFTSRYELMSCITKLQFITQNPCVDVIAVLSCHSSSQGQVFSCTPSAVSRCFEYEEFCSLHDFVQVLQDTLGQSLSAVHISSCFTLKLDCSHQDWPVDIGWIRTKLNCTLSGSTKEVYETGSQVADLHVLLATLLKPSSFLYSIGNALRSTIQSATTEEFPDLANEMGLEILSRETVGTKASRPCSDEEVSAPSQVNSSLHVVILIGPDTDGEHCQENSGKTQQALAEAIAANLKMRQLSDVKCTYSVLSLYGETSLKEKLQSWIYPVLEGEKKLFFVALGSLFAHPSINLLNIIHELILQSEKPNWFYGIHFQSLTPMQAYFLKTKLNTINTCKREESETKTEDIPASVVRAVLVATGLVVEGKPCPVYSFPVLLYMIHLAIGENGERISGQGITPAHLKYKQYRGPGISSWTLEDVYMETSYVLSGLSRKSGLCLLSFPTQTTLFVKGMKSGSRVRQHEDQEDIDCCNKVNEMTVDAVQIDHSDHSDDLNNCLSERTNTIISCSSDKASEIDTSALIQECNSAKDDHVVNNAGEIIPASDTMLQNDQCLVNTNGNGAGVDEMKRSTESTACTVKEMKLSSDLSDEDCNCSSTVLGSVSCVKPDTDEEEYVCITEDESCPVQSMNNSKDSKWDTSNDLPLMANVDEVLVTHYILNLEVNFDEKVMSGDITLFLKPATEVVLKRQFQLCLDCSLVHIESVEEINLRDGFNVKYYGTREQNDCDSSKCLPHSSDVFKVDKFKQSPVALPYSLLPYAVHNWCMRIWKPRNLGRTWPRCIRIKYRTKPEGKSLTWATDQDQRSCVFSPGAYINNRSLMPCQEPPIAMSTWQASIHVPKGCTVLMSGDQLPIMESNEDMATFLYEMSIPMPCSTLALAIGWFECRQSSTVISSCHIPCRVFSTPSLINRACEELLKPCTKYVSTACALLGPYPFTRVDLVILPKCFACMGLMSPNVAFLSQSILAGDESMCVRVAHEISHSWFGLLIGAKDWSEEWLSEGFATYMEERIQCQAEGWQGDEEVFRVELRQILRHRTLLAELQHADENMQQLRPQLPNVVTAAEAVRKSVEKHNSTSVEGEQSDNGECDTIVPHTTVTNGQVCSRKWTQIHYLKGYFLLHYMATMVGSRNFDNFLKDYVKEYGGKLVNSEEFFDFFQKGFPSLGNLNLKDQLIQEWLECRGLPEHVPRKIGRPDNFLVNQVENEFVFWKKTDAVNKRKKTQQIRSKKPVKDHPKVSDQIQLVVLLERMLERDVLATATLTQLDNCYNFASKNAEVRHRWCELVVKHRYQPGLSQVKRFLIEDQGMGIYLFGELIISQQPKQKQLVLEVLSIIGAEMDQCTLKTVQDMLEGKD